MPHYLTMPSPQLKSRKKNGIGASEAQCASCRAFVFKYSTTVLRLLLPSPSWRNGNCIFSWAKTMGTSISNLHLPPLIGAVFAQRLGFLCRAWLPTDVVPIPAAGNNRPYKSDGHGHATQIRNYVQFRFSQITRMRCSPNSGGKQLSSKFLQRKVFIRIRGGAV